MHSSQHNIQQEKQNKQKLSWQTSCPVSSGVSATASNKPFNSQWLAATFCLNKMTLAHSQVQLLYYKTIPLASPKTSWGYFDSTDSKFKVIIKLRWDAWDPSHRKECSIWQGNCMSWWSSAIMQKEKKLEEPAKKVTLITNLPWACGQCERWSLPFHRQKKERTRAKINQRCFATGAIANLKCTICAALWTPLQVAMMYSYQPNKSCFGCIFGTCMRHYTTAGTAIWHVLKQTKYWIDSSRKRADIDQPQTLQFPKAKTGNCTARNPWNVSTLISCDALLQLLPY